MSHTTRESWLAAAVEALRPMYAGHKRPLPDKIRVSCGWPSRGGTSAKRVRMGECWNPDSSQDNTVEIFVTPRVGDAVEALGILSHELVHAALFGADLPRHGHGKHFQELAGNIGLEAPWTETRPGPTLAAVLADLAKTLGDYPASALTPKAKEKKQTTRMLKCACPKCGYTLRTTQKWIDVAVPYCPADETRMIVGGSDGPKSEGEGEEGGATLEGLAEGNPPL